MQLAENECRVRQELVRHSHRQQSLETQQLQRSLELQQGLRRSLELHQQLQLLFTFVCDAVLPNIRCVIDGATANIYFVALFFDTDLELFLSVVEGVVLRICRNSEWPHSIIFRDFDVIQASAVRIADIVNQKLDKTQVPVR
jgi:hypothetical protein